MWNRFMSSPYAHFVTAIVLTLGLVLGLLVDHPGRSSLAKFDASAQKAPANAITTGFDRGVLSGQPSDR